VDRSSGHQVRATSAAVRATAAVHRTGERGRTERITLLGNRVLVVDARDGLARLLSVPVVGFAEEGMGEQHQGP
jgi:hypothetical protein